LRVKSVRSDFKEPPEFASRIFLQNLRRGIARSAAKLLAASIAKLPEMLGGKD